MENTNETQNIFKVHILDENNEIKETRDVIYNVYRLTTKDLRELRSKANMMNFIDTSSVNPENTEESAKAAVKSIDFKSYSEAKELAIDECIRIVFGLKDVELDRIAAKDFSPLRAAIKNDDLLEFGKDDLEQAELAKKKAQLKS